MNSDNDNYTAINKIIEPDEFYDDLIKAHEGLSDDQSRQLNSRLILLMSNQIADNKKLRSLITLARSSLDIA